MAQELAKLAYPLNDALLRSKTADIQEGILPRFMRFLIVGGLNTLFGLGAYSLLVYLKLPLWLALLGGNLSGIAFNFFSTGGLVFRDLSTRRIPRFVLAYLIVYSVNLALLHAASGMLQKPLLAQVVLTIPMAILSYVLMSRWVFKADALVA